MRREDALHQVARWVPLSDIQRALALVDRRRDRRVAVVGNDLLGRWATANPAAALAYAQRLPPSAKRDNSLRIVLEEWASQNASAAAAWTSEQLRGREKKAALNAVLVAVAGESPQRALDVLESLSGLQSKEPFRAMILRRWAEEDPAGAAAATAKMRGISSGTYGEIASQWASKDPKAALGWAQRLPTGQTRNRAVEQVVQVWAGTDPEAAASFALSQAKSTVQAHLLESVAQQWAATDVNGAMDWANHLTNGPGRVRAIQKVVEEWAKTDPATAANYALTLTPDEGQRRLLALVGGHWAEQDPENAVNWTKQLPASIQREVGSAIISKVVDEDPKSAATLVMSFDPSVQCERSFGEESMVGKVARVWAEQDLPGALSWIKGLPTGTMRDEALENLAGEWAASDPKAAATYVTDTLTSEAASRREACQLRIADSWAHTAPEEAASWAREAGIAELQRVATTWASDSPIEAALYAAKQPADRIGLTFADSVAFIWAETNPEAASQWAMSFPESVARKAAIDSVARAWASQDPAAAANWLQGFVDPGQLEYRVQDMLLRWAMQDPDGARSWIQSSTLSEAAKQRLLARYWKN